MAERPNNDDPGVVLLLKEAAWNLGALVSDHLRLARAELADDVKEHIRGVELRALAASLLLVGYGLACVAAALTLARWVTLLGGFLAISAANVLAGVVVLSITSHRLRSRRALRETTRALAQTASTLTARIG